jgi:hypothetical protein
MSSACYILHFAAASTPLSTSQYVRYHAQAPNAPTAAVYWVKHPSSQLQLKHTTDIYFHFLNTICKTSAQFQKVALLSMDPNTAFHIFYTSSDDRSVRVYNKNWTMEQIKNLNNIQQYKYLHTITLKFLAHILHFTKTIGPWPQVTIF